MGRYVKAGTWLVLVPGAVACLRYMGHPNPTSPTAIYELLEQLGLLDDIDREKGSIIATISKRLGKQFAGLVPD